MLMEWLTSMSAADWKCQDWKYQDWKSVMQTRRIGLSIDSTIDPSLTQKSTERLTEWLT